jgi:hypothetical protein
MKSDFFLKYFYFLQLSKKNMSEIPEFRLLAIYI